MNTMKARQQRTRMNNIVEDATKQAIVSNTVASIYILDKMGLSKTEILKYFNELRELYALPEIFGKSVSDRDIQKTISEKFPGANFGELFSIIKVNIE